MFVLNVVDGCIPSRRAQSPADIDEERRLLYVAMTRAMDELTLMVPRRPPNNSSHRGRGRHATSVRSPFIPDGVLHHFDQEFAMVDKATNGSGHRPNFVGVDLKSMILQEATR